MTGFIIGLVVGAVVAALMTAWRGRGAQAALAEAGAQAPAQEMQALAGIQAAQDALREQQDQAERQRRGNEQRLAQMERDHAKLLREMGERIGEVKTKALRNCDSLAGIQAAQDALREQQNEAERQRRESEQRAAQMERDHAKLLREMGERIGEVKAKALRNCDSLAGEIGQLLGLVKTFERWHAEMNTLLAHNREMHSKSE